MNWEDQNTNSLHYLNDAQRKAADEATPHPSSTGNAPDVGQIAQGTIDNEPVIERYRYDGTFIGKNLKPINRSWMGKVEKAILGHSLEELEEQSSGEIPSNPE